MDRRIIESLYISKKCLTFFDAVFCDSKAKRTAKLKFKCNFIKDLAPLCIVLDRYTR